MVKKLMFLKILKFEIAVYNSWVLEIYKGVGCLDFHLGFISIYLG